MRRIRTGIFGSLFVGTALVSSVASAQNQDGFAVNRFDPSERGSDWFWAESLDLRGHNRWAIGAVGDWGHKPLVAYDENGDEVAALVENQVYLHLGASVVFWDRLRLGLNLPVLVYQNGEDVSVGGDDFTAPNSAAIGDLRLGADVRLFGEYGGPATLALGMQVHLPTGSRTSYSGDESARLVPKVTFAGDVGILTYAVKTGVNVRFLNQDFASLPFGPEWVFGGAVGLRLLDKKLTVGPELWASTVLEDPSRGFFESGTTPVEGVLGAHYKIADSWRVGLGVGPGLTRGIGAPTVRTLLSVEWFPEPEEKKEQVAAPLDRDQDGIFDSEDACPIEAGERSDDPKKNGCPPPADRDGDGIVDDEDACPAEAGVPSDDSKKHGCPIPDSDGDGILDPDDACVSEAGKPHPEDRTKHGCADPKDSDGDEILDPEDACPVVPGKPNTNPKKNGCPEAIIEEGKITILDRIEFDTGKATIRSESNGVLEAVLKILKEHPEIEKVRVEGHTDAKGIPARNKTLSQRRAEAVVKWLVDHGVQKARLVAAGFGQEQPIDSNDTDEGRQNNRRVEFKILKDGKEAK